MKKFVEMLVSGISVTITIAFNGKLVSLIVIDGYEFRVDDDRIIIEDGICDNRVYIPLDAEFEYDDDEDEYVIKLDEALSYYISINA